MKPTTQLIALCHFIKDRPNSMWSQLHGFPEDLEHLSRNTVTEANKRGYIHQVKNGIWELTSTGIDIVENNKRPLPPITSSAFLRMMRMFYQIAEYPEVVKKTANDYYKKYTGATSDI